MLQDDPTTLLREQQALTAWDSLLSHIAHLIRLACERQDFTYILSVKLKRRPVSDFYQFRVGIHDSRGMIFLSGEDNTLSAYLRHYTLGLVEQHPVMKYLPMQRTVTLDEASAPLTAHETISLFSNAKLIGLPEIILKDLRRMIQTPT